MAEGTQLAERGKERISAAEAIEKVKALVKRRYNHDRAQSDRARAEMERFAGGQTQRLDKDAIEQGRSWAARLALISRQTSGHGYQASKGNAAIAGAVKKIFGIIGELEAMLATDAEISLFQPVRKNDYYANTYGRTDLSCLKASDLVGGLEPGETLDTGAIADMLCEEFVGEKAEADVRALLEEYEIEPIVAPEEPEDEQPKRNGRRRRS